MTADTTILTVPTTAGPTSNVASGQLPNPIQTFTVGTTGVPVPAKPAPKLVFLDTETTSLRPDRRAWEIAAIVRHPGAGKDIEYTWSVTTGYLDLGNADPASLRIGRFYDRHPQFADDGDPRVLRAEPEIADELEALTRGAIIVGAIPNFDTHVLDCMFRRNSLCPAWDHHLVDVESLAAGALRMAPPWKLDTFLAAYGITDDPADRHTALGDARRVRDLYDAVMASKQVAE